MHSESLPVTGDKQLAGPWWRELNRYHVFVFTVAALGWLFDTMDQQLFTLARKPAVQDLLAVAPGDSKVEEYSGYATSIFIMGWGVGGLIFGVVGDRYGRVRTMVLTILLYSLFTGLSALSRGFWDFAFYRFLTGLGVGGEFAVGVALVAEVMPDRARPFALGWLQACSAVGNITAALTSMLLGHFQVHNAWRLMFLVGVLPALLAIIIMRRLREPERWTALAKEDGVTQQLGSLRELFGTPRWRRNTIVGMFLAFAGVVGLWGIGFFSPDLTRIVFRKTFESQGLSPEAVAGKLTLWAGITSLLLNGGAFFGIQAFIWLTHRTGRRPAFALGFIVAAASTAITFWYLKELEHVYWMMPLMGFCQLSVFGGYAIYFPELFPTRLRSTGTSFCYNVGRFAAAVGPSALGLLTHRVFADKVEPMRYAGVTMCSVFLLGLLVLPFAPETRGQPLPE
jgi:MFS family permease